LSGLFTPPQGDFLIGVLVFFISCPDPHFRGDALLSVAVRPPAGCLIHFDGFPSLSSCWRERSDSFLCRESFSEPWWDPSMDHSTIFLIWVSPVEFSSFRLRRFQSDSAVFHRALELCWQAVLLSTRRITRPSFAAAPRQRVLFEIFAHSLSSVLFPLHLSNAPVMVPEPTLWPPFPPSSRSDSALRPQTGCVIRGRYCYFSFSFSSFFRLPLCLCLAPPLDLPD